MPHGGLRHDLAQLGEDLSADDGRIGIEQGGRGAGFVLVQQPAERIDIERLEQETIRRSGYFRRRFAAADDINEGLGTGAELRDQLRPLRPGICASMRITSGRKVGWRQAFPAIRLR